MEVVAVVVAMEALAFVIAFGFTLAVGWRAVVVAGLVIVLIFAFIASVLARAGHGLLFDFLPREAFTVALLFALLLYAGLALGVGSAAWARSWAARRG
jgi:hypothetical protein